MEQWTISLTKIIRFQNCVYLRDLKIFFNSLLISWFQGEIQNQKVVQHQGPSYNQSKWITTYFFIVIEIYSLFPQQHRMINEVI